MSQRFSIQLGEFRLAKYDLGSKAATLDVVALKDLSNKGLMPAKFVPVQMPVPESCVVLDEFYRHAIETGLAKIENGEVLVPDPRAFMDSVELPPITGRVAVRSAFTAEDRTDSTYTGRFETVLNVPIESFSISPSRVCDPRPLANAIAKVWTSGLKGDVTGRMDVLVMRMVDARYSGVAFTEVDYEDDLVNYTDGLANEMLAGRKPGKTLELAKLQPLETPSKEHVNLPFVPRLQVLLRSIRLALGKGNWDVEWADDGDKTWIIQIRPITAPTIRNEVFTYAPLRESLPELPSRFMATLIESAGDEIFELYREADPSLPARRKYIEVLYGRPMVNLSLMMDMARQWGLPTSSVTWMLRDRAPNEAKANRRRLMGSRSIRMANRMKAMRAAKQSREVAEEILAVARHPGDSVSEVIESARKVYAKLMKQMLVLRDAIGPKYNAGGHSVAAQMYSELRPMREMVQANIALANALEKGQVPRDSNFRHRWESWMKKHGHRGVYETDLARPRFRENQTEVLQMIAQAPGSAPARRSPLKDLAPKSPAAKATFAREELRFEAMRAFELLRHRLLELALPKGVTAEMLFALSVDEAKQLDGNWRPSTEFMQARMDEIEQFAGLRIPDVIRRSDVLEAGGGVAALHGVGLTRGEAVGRALILKAPVTKLPQGYEPGETILVVSTVDAGWVPTFGIVSGVVIESGSNLSHGSIILRELGIPSVTDVRGATREIRDGQRIRVVGAHGRVDILSGE